MNDVREQKQIRVINKNLRKRAGITNAVRGNSLMLVHSALQKGFTDENTQNSGDIAATGIVAETAVCSTVKLPVKTYRLCRTTKKAVKCVYRKGSQLKYEAKEAAIRTAAATYIKDWDTSYISESGKTQDYGIYRRKKRMDDYSNRIVAEAEAIGISTSDKKIRTYNEKQKLKYGRQNRDTANDNGIVWVNERDGSGYDGNGMTGKGKTGKRKTESKGSEDKIKKAKNGSQSKMAALAKGALISAATSADSSEGTVAKRIGVYYTFAVARPVTDLAKLLLTRLAVTAVKMRYVLLAVLAPLVFLPCIFMVILMVLMQIPPLKWMTTPAEAAPIVITYQERMKEFGIKVNSFEPDDNSIISYEINEEELRRNALIIFLAKKGMNYDFTEVPEEDAKLYATILSEMMLCTMDIKGYVEISDGSLITTKLIDATVKKSDDPYGNMNGVYAAGSCNVHGVTGRITTSGAVIHTTGRGYFIPCEVSQYSVLPVGLCIQITEPESGKKYILQIVDKVQDKEEDNEYLYICGDMRTEDDNGAAKDINIYTDAYGAVRYFSNTNLQVFDEEVCYTGILDKARANEFPTYNIIYRSATSLAKEFEMTDEEQQEVFGALNRVTDEELKDAKILVPRKEINIWGENIDYYAEKNLSYSEQETYKELQALVAENREAFEKYTDALLGSMSEETITDELKRQSGSEADSMAAYVADIYLQYGRYLPANASQLAKFVDDNGMSVPADELKNGDFVFISRDVGTYKNVTDVAVKTEKGYLNYTGGKIVYEETLRINGFNSRGSIVMYGRLD